SKFLLRQAQHAVVAFLIVGGSLAIGILGYHFTEGLSWLDSLLNASMILGGMGPTSPINTVAGKLFASFYALFAGMVFLVAVGVLFAPTFHRLMHRFHLEATADDADGDGVETQRRQVPMTKP
ncbi:MAG TPA: hypothetical protein VF806_02370, partial [Anaerolineaceae bacterium]